MSYNKFNIIYALTAISILTYTSCQEHINSLDYISKEKLSFSELPQTVKELISLNIDSILNSSEDIYFNTNDSITFIYGRGGIGDNWIDEVSSNYHHFFINNIHYRLHGNKGDPFILHEGYLYYCELNLYKDDYEKRNYYRIKIEY